jgi:hypothetical protein
VEETEGDTMTSISYEQLVDLAEGRVPTEAREAMLAQIEADPETAREWRQVQGLIRLMRDDDSVDAPPHLIQETVHMFKPTPKPNLVERIVAVLTFDSFATAAAGVRGSTDVRQLIFTAREREIDIRVAPESDRWHVSGQILGKKAHGRAELIETETNAGAAAATLNALSEFDLPSVAAGPYRLYFRLEDVEIDIPNLELGASTR